MEFCFLMGILNDQVLVYFFEHELVKVWMMVRVPVTITVMNLSFQGQDMTIDYLDLK